MLQKTISSLFNTLTPKPLPFNEAEVLDAFAKVSRILDKAVIPAHVETAENMFINMLKRYGFDENARKSPLILAMQAKINERRAAVQEEFERANARMVAA